MRHGVSDSSTRGPGKAWRKAGTCASDETCESNAPRTAVSWRLEHGKAVRERERQSTHVTGPAGDTGIPTSIGWARISQEHQASLRG